MNVWHMDTPHMFTSIWDTSGMDLLAAVGVFFQVGMKVFCASTLLTQPQATTELGELSK